MNISPVVSDLLDNFRFISFKWKSTFSSFKYAFNFIIRGLFAQSAGAVEYTDCTSAEG